MHKRHGYVAAVRAAWPSVRRKVPGAQCPWNGGVEREDDAGQAGQKELPGARSFFLHPVFWQWEQFLQ